MRTTVEIPDEQRARLLEVAARRGEKGFSALVQEAIARYLDELARREERAVAALAVLGTLDAEEEDELRRSIDAVRGRWR